MTKAAGSYYLNDKSEFYWEICRSDKVVKFIKKTADDDNINIALREVAKFNQSIFEGMPIP